ncbi:MAG: type II secretion system F family protein [Janthinobacterium lividum]
MLYSYQAKDRTGRTITGALDAESERQAAQEIRDMGYFPMRLAPQRGGAATLSPKNTPSQEQSTQSSSMPNGPSLNGTALNGTASLLPRRKMSLGLWLLAHLVFPLFSGVSLRDMALMYRQFTAMLGAGVPIYQCLTSLTQQTSNAVLRKHLRRITACVQEGEMLTTAMSEVPWIFSDFQRAMISAGEVSGRLDTMMARLSSALEQEYALRNNIKREMFEPIATLLASFLLPPLVLVVVNHDLHAYLVQAVYPLLETAAILLVIYVVGKLLAQFKLVFDAIIYSLPGIGGAVRMIAVARFSRAFASLYAAGVGIPEAIKFSSAATGNEFLSRRISSAIPAIMGGQGIGDSLAATRAFPPMVVSMLRTGEQTGGLDMTMDKVAEYYEAEAVVRLHQLTVTLRTAALILGGIRVLMILIQFYGGYANQLNDMSNPDNQQ